MMRKRRPKKHRALLSLVMLILVTALLLEVTGAMSYFKLGSFAKNFLYAMQFKVDLVDIFDGYQFALPGDTKNKDVYMVNSGKTDAVVRISLIPAWDPQESNGEPLDTGVVTIAYGPAFAADWTYLNGWYYYNRILQPGESTSYLVDSLKLNAVANDHHAADYAEAVYTLAVQGESLQAITEATQDNWNATFQVGPGGELSWSEGGA